MEEIKIWSVDSAGASQLTQADAVSSELLLEKTLVSHPDLLLPGLKLVGRQTPTEGGPLDLLGVDEDGRLVVFELKRGTLSRDAVAQVIDYASYLDALEDDALSRHIAGNSGNHGIEKIDDFQEWYGEGVPSRGLESLRPVRMYLVGLGVDDRTERMVHFLAKNSRLDISLLTFYGFNYGGKTLLARQVRVLGESEPALPSENVFARARNYGVHDLFVDVRKMFEDRWYGPYDHVHDQKTCTSFSAYRRAASGTWVSHRYARVDPREDGVGISFYGRAIELSPEDFKQPIQQIENVTFPPNVKTDLLDRTADSGLDLTSSWVEIQFQVTTATWGEHKESLGRLTRAVYEALQVKNQRGSSAVADLEDEKND